MLSVYRGKELIYRVGYWTFFVDNEILRKKGVLISSNINSQYRVTSDQTLHRNLLILVGSSERVRPCLGDDIFGSKGVKETFSSVNCAEFHRL